MLSAPGAIRDNFRTQVMSIVSPGWSDVQRSLSGQQDMSHLTTGSTCPLSMSDLTSGQSQGGLQYGPQNGQSDHINNDQFMNDKLGSLARMNGNESWRPHSPGVRNGGVQGAYDPNYPTYGPNFNSSWKYGAGSWKYNSGNYTSSSYDVTGSSFGKNVDNFQDNLSQYGSHYLNGSNGYAQVGSTGYPTLDGSTIQYKPVSIELKEHRQRIAQIDQQLLSIDKEIMGCDSRERKNGYPTDSPSYHALNVTHGASAPTWQLSGGKMSGMDSSNLSLSPTKRDSAGDYVNVAHGGINSGLSTQYHDLRVPRLNSYMSGSLVSEPALTLTQGSYEGQAQTPKKMYGNSIVECSNGRAATSQRKPSSALGQTSGKFTSTAIQTSPNKNDLELAPSDLSLALTPARGWQGSQVMSSNKLTLGRGLKGRTIQSNLPLDDLSPLFSNATPLKLSTGLPTKSGSHLPRSGTRGIENRGLNRDVAIVTSDENKMARYQRGRERKRSWSSPRTSVDSDESVSSEEDVDSLLNRSVELQSHIRVSCDETDAYQPLSPTGWRGYSPSPTQFTRSLRRTHSVESFVGKFDTDSNSFTITSMRTNMRWEDAYVYGSPSPSMVSPTYQEGTNRCYTPSSSSSTCMPRSTTEESTTGSSSTHWAIRLIEALHNADPVTRQKLMLKARCFRRWQKLARETKRRKKKKVPTAPLR